MSDLLKVRVGGSSYLCKFKYNDPRILMLWYGTSENITEPTGGISNPTIEYDTNGPLDLTGTSWSGTPCIAKSNLGGRLTGPWLVSGKGLQWTQSSIIEQIQKNKPFTVEFWLRNNYPTSDAAFADGGYPLAFITKQTFQMSGTDIIPNPLIGGWYGQPAYSYIYSTSYFTRSAPGTAGNIWGGRMYWAHCAVCNDGTGNKSGLHWFANGTEMKYSGKVFGEMFDNTQFSWVLNNTQALVFGNFGESNACDWRMAQLAVFNYCKYTQNFTPQRKPYFLGID